jgi:hypothetical protein
LKRTQRIQQAVGGTASPEATSAPRSLIDAGGDAFNVAEANRNEPLVGEAQTVRRGQRAWHAGRELSENSRDPMRSCAAALVGQTTEKKDD